MTLLVDKDSGLRIEVDDTSTDEPEMADPLADVDNDDLDSNGGRGLLLVDALADEWGYDLHEGGRPSGRDSHAGSRPSGRTDRPRSSPGSPARHSRPTRGLVSS
jgi:hypothetical protein